MQFRKENISFILIEPQEPGNIGAAARALKNMGFKNLELVNPVHFHTKEAKWMSCQAYNMIKQAIVYSNFEDAIKDKNLIVGTTRRLGSRRGLIIPLKDSIRRIITVAKKNKVAILFGRERNGLTNKEVKECGFMITIPADTTAPSLNVAQSVLLVAYELSRKTYKTSSPELVRHEELGSFYKRLEEILNLLEYVPRGDRDLERKIIQNIKHLAGRSGLTEWELNMLHGICSQVERKINSKIDNYFVI